jgi:hypothetical protein
MSYDPYSLFGEEGEMAEKAPTPSSQPLEYNPADLFGVEEETPVEAPTEAPTTGVLDQVGINLPEQRMGTGVNEAALSMLSSAVAQPISGLVGLGATLFGDAEAGARMVEATQKALTYQPRTEEGRAALESVGAFLSPVADAITGTSEFLGDTAESMGATPAVSTFMYTLPEAALTVIPAGVGVKASRAAKLAKQTEATKVRSNLLATDPDARLASATGANYKLDANGIAVPNEMGRRLVKNEIARPSDAALITNSDKATKIQMKAMTEAFNKTAEGAPTVSPSQIIGQNAGRALKQVNEARQKVGKQLDELVNGEMGNTKVDVGAPLGAFYGELKDLGVSFRYRGDKFTVDFEDTDLDLATFAPARRVIEDAVEMTRKSTGSTLKDTHKLKQRLDSLLDAKKLEQGGQLGDAERMIFRLRSGLNDAAKNVDGYAQLNARYTDLRDALSSFDSYKPAGKSWDSPKVMNNVGAAMKSAATDTAAMNNMIDSLADASRVMQQVGAKPFDVDVYGLARYNDFLNGQFQKSVTSSAPKSGRAMLNNLTGLGISAGVGNKFGMANNAVGLVRNTADAATYRKILATNKNNQRLVMNALSN